MKRSEYIVAARTKIEIPNVDQQVPDSAIGSAIDAALEEFSRDVPLTLVEEQIGQSEYRLQFPSRWKDDFSIVKQIRLLSDVQPIIIDENGWQPVRMDETKRSVSNISSGATSVTLTTATHAKYFKQHALIIIGNTGTPDTYEYNYVTASNSSTGVVTLLNAVGATYNSTPYIAKIKHILLTAITPGSTDVMELHYTAQRQLGNDQTGYGDEVESCGKVEAFKHLAAAYSAEAVAANFAKNQPNNQLLEAQIGTTNVEHWLNLARANRDAYKRLIGEKIGDEESKAAVIMGSMQSRSLGDRLLIWQNEVIEDESYTYR